MRLLYSHRTRSADGQYVHIRALTGALAEIGVDVAMCGPDDEGADAAARPLSAGDGAKGLKDRLPKAAYELAEMAYSLAGYRRLAAAARRTRPDVLYERYNLHYFAGVWARKRLGLPLILEVNAPLAEERAAHGGLALEARARAHEASVWRAADHLLPVTGVLAEKIAAAGVPESRITVVPNGVTETAIEGGDATAARLRFGLADKIVLGFTGFLRPWHGVDRAIRYLAARPEAPLHLLIVGDGPARSDLHGLARALGVSEKTSFAGVVQPENLPDVVAAFDIALQPAVTAYASPLKLFDYMAAGKPAVAPATPNIKEVLNDGETGVFFDEGSDKAFFGAIDQLVDDRRLRERIGAAAREWIIRTDRTWQGNARTVRGIADGLIAPRAAA